MHDPKKIRNLAIVAHIDHGKTTLMDSLLKQSESFRENEVVPERVMDNYDQEKERGITIFAKHTSLFYKDYKINLIDTPGHADFSGEVERVLGLVNSVLLLVDASEGPMPQTRFVLSQALKKGLSPIVLLNKIDRPHANPDRALNITFDLFVELGASDAQLDFSVCYASGLAGFAKRNLEDESSDMSPLFDLILEAVPPPTGNPDAPFLLQATTVSYDEFTGRQACGRILNGSISKGDAISRIRNDGSISQHKVTKVEGYQGLKKIALDAAGVGDIVNIAGVPDVQIGETLGAPNNTSPLPPIQLDEPTMSIELSVNSGPLAGRDGKHVTMNKLRARLEQEKKANISLSIEDVPGKEDVMRVAGRGEIHLAVLIEAMRREGFEMLLARPQVILKETPQGKLEPYESVHIEVPEEFSGSVIEELSRKYGEMRSLNTNEHNITLMEFLAPTRALMGYRNNFLTATKGLGILTSAFDSFAPHKGLLPKRSKGVLVSMMAGKASGYALFNLQDRGTLFISPGTEVYEGMIIGEHCREGDLLVNPVKEKQLTNMRASGTDDNIQLSPHTKFSLEQAINFIEDDELVEVTPQFIRLRKRFLTENERKKRK